MIIKMPKIKCERCGHQWVPRIKDVRECPSCQSPRFDEKRYYEPIEVNAEVIAPVAGI